VLVGDQRVTGELRSLFSQSRHASRAASSPRCAYSGRSSQARMVFSSTLARKKRSSVACSGPNASDRASRNTSRRRANRRDSEPHQHVGLHEAGDVAEESLLTRDAGAQAACLSGPMAASMAPGAST